MTINHAYEVSSEGGVRHWEVPYARLEHVTPEETHPAALLSLLPGTQLTGTVLTIDATLSVAVVDFTPGMVYRHTVRNVRTYNPGVAELTWGAIQIGDPIYYDRTAALAALLIFLTTSPLDLAGAANPLFGFAVDDGSGLLTWPLGNLATVLTPTNVPVLQVGTGR